VLEFIRATGDDREYLFRLRKNTMTEHLEKSGQYLTEEEHWRRLNEDYHYSHLIILNARKVGTLKFQVTPDFIDVMQLQIEPKRQGQGIGSRVIEQVLNHAGSRPVKLTVLKDNPALKLYKKYGFKVIGEDDYEYFMQVDQY